jgi:molecular chaperone DnaK (HSP70)
MSAAKGLCVGIDLGTTWSCVACASQEGVTVLDPIPSIVSFHEQESETIRLLGEDVRLWEHLRGIPNAEHLLYDSKRMIGKSYEDVDQDLKNWPFKVVDGRDGRPFYVGKLPSGLCIVVFLLICFLLSSYQQRASIFLT